MISKIELLVSRCDICEHSKIQQLLMKLIYQNIFNKLVLIHFKIILKSFIHCKIHNLE